MNLQAIVSSLVSKCCCMCKSKRTLEAQKCSLHALSVLPKHIVQVSTFAFGGAL